MKPITSEISEIMHYLRGDARRIALVIRPCEHGGFHLEGLYPDREKAFESPCYPHFECLIQAFLSRYVDATDPDMRGDESDETSFEVIQTWLASWQGSEQASLEAWRPDHEAQ